METIQVDIIKFAGQRVTANFCCKVFETFNSNIIFVAKSGLRLGSFWITLPITPILSPLFFLSVTDLYIVYATLVVGERNKWNS